MDRSENVTDMGQSQRQKHVVQTHAQAQAHGHVPAQAHVQVRGIANANQQKKVKDILAKTLPSLPRRIFSTNETNTVCFASNLRGDTRADGSEMRKNQSQSHGVENFQNGDRSGGDVVADSAKKLKVRGLKTFVEKRGCGIPPSWVKEFPCRSRFNPDLFLYDFQEGPFNPKRNVEAMSQCPLHGGRCVQCGVYTKSLCSVCKRCESDCACVCPEEICSKNQNQTNDGNLNPLCCGLTSMESFSSTLSNAQKILQSSQNAPTQYPFKFPTNNTLKPTNVPFQNHQQEIPSFQQPTGYTVPSYPYTTYPYGYPPLPYMIPPPPPIYGYPYPPPQPIGYPNSLQPQFQIQTLPPQYLFPYQTPQMSSPSGEISTKLQPTTTTRTFVSVNNPDRLQ